MTSGKSPNPTGSRSRLRSIGRQAAWFAAIGGVMTLAYFALYLMARTVLGPQSANYLAWGVTAVLDTAANRRFTFDAAARIGQGRAQVEGMLVFGLGLGLTSCTLLVLDASVDHPGRLLELAALATANLVAGLLRFELLRRWVFAPGRRLAVSA